MQQEIAKEQLKRHEGFSPSLYKCPAGKPTIGFGFNLEQELMPEFVASIWLENLIDGIDFELDQRFTFYNCLSEIRKSVLINMRYNLGMAGLLSFKKMIKALEDGNYHEAANQMRDSKWHTQVGQRAIELEILMENG